MTPEPTTPRTGGEPRPADPSPADDIAVLPDRDPAPVQPAAPDPTPAPDPSAATPPGLRRRIRPTVRLRLTLWYSGLFLLAGILLLGLNYLLVRQSLVDSPATSRAAVAKRLGITPELIEPMRPPPDEDDLPARGIFVGGVHVGELIRQVQQELNAETLRQLVLMSGIALAVILALSVGLGWVVAGRMLRPLHEITETARHLSEATLPSRRIALEGPHDELKELADTFDAMLARLDAAFSAQKEFVANASHELRTPLTIIRAEIDVALDDPDLSRTELEAMGEAVRDAVDRSEGLIDGLLVLARAEGSMAQSTVDLAEVIRRQSDELMPRIRAQGLAVELHVGPAAVAGDPALLDRMVANLLDNAVRHNMPGGWMRATASTIGDHAVLAVSNSGQPIPAEDAERLFERFYRQDRSRSRKTGGFGLGLSIVRSVARAHGGSATARPLAEGGLEVIVTMPVARTGATARSAGTA